MRSSSRTLVPVGTIATIPLGGVGPETSSTTRRAGESSSASRRATNSRSSTPASGPSPLAYRSRTVTPNHSLLVDDRARLLLVGCSGNGRLLVLDADAFTPFGHVDGAGHIDVLALDSGSQRAYATAEDGVITVLQLRRGLRPRLQGRDTLRRAHTIAIDPRTHLAYLPLGRPGGGSTLQILRPTPG